MKIAEILALGDWLREAVVSDIQGVSARAMLRAILAGETNPATLADLARGRLREKRDQLLPALEGHVRVAEVVLTEIGCDVTRFPAAGQLASWVGVCPGNHQSAGKRYSGRTQHGNVWLR